MTPVRAFSAVFGSALLGETCHVIETNGTRRLLPVEEWRQSASDSDLALVAACRGTTLDVGCGPGRLTEALARVGLPAFGIDIVSEAVRQTRARGVPAMRRDVFDRLPGEGRWDTVLVADGNIGIGGDPELLLHRIRSLLSPDGRTVVELAPPGAGLSRSTLQLATDGARSRAFAWATVGVDAWPGLAVESGLVPASVQQAGDRWFAVARRSA